MPTYSYKKCWCESNRDGTHERNVPIEERNTQKCQFCGATLVRDYTFNGLTWAPTAGGMR